MKKLENTSTCESIEGITQLIVDMVACDAPREDIYRAVQHSILIINAAHQAIKLEKAMVERDRSFVDNRVSELFEKYC